MRPHKVRGWLNRADDPSFWVRAGPVCRLYLDPPPGTILVSGDEKTGIQAKSRKHAGIPARPGRDARRECEYLRHGTVSIVAAMNVATGQVIASGCTGTTPPPSSPFLAMLDQLTPPLLRIHLIMDNGSSPHLQGDEGLDRRPAPVLGDVHPQARVLAEHHRAT